MSSGKRHPFCLGLNVLNGKGDCIIIIGGVWKDVNVAAFNTNKEK